MTEFYVAASKKIALPNGRPFQLRRGIHALPDDLANHPSANGHGIKPVGEMTDDEWFRMGYTPAQRREIEERHGLHPVPQPDPAPEDAPVDEAETKAPQTAPQAPAPQPVAPAVVKPAVAPAEAPKAS